MTDTDNQHDMTDQSAPPSPPPQRRRRSSFIEMFNRPQSTSAVSSSPPSTTVPPHPTSSQHRRGTSISGLGLTTNPSSQPSPFTAFQRQRRASIATSTTSNSPDFKNSFGDEPAVLEEDEANPSSPSFARRVSFGAQALRDVKLGSSPGTAGGEGFNWSEALRDRSRRSPSFSSGNPFTQGANRPRGASITNPEPLKEITKPVESMSTPVRMKKPDHLGERMLRGDFMMD
ncbi:hypothetical protein EDD37DRAFT_467255 [Exophiala viscosa]|uniref:uncharacterized protein n=1 Tax=Exophiala viscosa TaxID=2486360 RepID=UPI0021A23706|nr:hypothetical protein EDD37DRAFT_467255 [Exophiala viscosa]